MINIHTLHLFTCTSLKHTTDENLFECYRINVLYKIDKLNKDEKKDFLIEKLASWRTTDFLEHMKKKIINLDKNFTNEDKKKIYYFYIDYIKDDIKNNIDMDEEDIINYLANKICLFRYNSYIEHLNNEI